MNRLHVGQIVVGVAGAIATYAVAPPGEHVLAIAALRFDPALAVIGGFVFLSSWGIAMALRQVGAFRTRAEATRFDPTEAAVIVGFSVAAGVLAGIIAALQTDLNVLSILVTVAATVVLTAVVFAVGFVLVNRYDGR